MDLEQYIKNAIRTESRIDHIETCRVLLYNTLQIFIASGQILDQIKKNTFYQKPFDEKQIDDNIGIMKRSINVIERVGLSEGTEQRIYSPEEQFDPRVFHAIIGIATESTELCEALFDTMFSSKAPYKIDIVNLLEENGDINWYQAIMIDALGGDWENIMNTNIEKLRKRFPDKFTNEHAQNRDLDAEREILDKMEAK